MSPLLSLLFALWSLAGSDVVVHQVDGPVRFTDLYGSEREAAGAVGCPEGGPAHLWLSLGVDTETLVHEMAHVWDCVDDGLMNASPIDGVRPPVRPVWVSDYCWNTDAEWYACWAAYSRSVDASPLEPLPSTRYADTTRLEDRHVH